MKDANENGGVASVRKIEAGNDDEITRVGDLVVEPAFPTTGRLIQADGTPLPPEAWIMRGREQPWDPLPNVDVSADRRFVFEGVRQESVSASPKLKGYQFSLRKPSLDRLNGFSVVGRVEGNIDDLVILLEPGNFGDYLSDPGPDPQPYNKPLRPFQGVVPLNAQ